MIIKGIFYDDQLRSFRQRMLMIKIVAEMMESVPKKELYGRPDIGFKIKMPPKSGGGAIDYPKPAAKLPKSEADSPYWSHQIGSSIGERLNMEAIWRSNMPITSTAVMGGAWGGAASGWLFNRFLKDRLVKGIVRTTIRNPYAAAGLLYASAAIIVSHDVAIAVTRTPEQRSFWLGGWKLDSGMSLGSAIT